jgi:zinc transport system substrate-binding protein
MRRRRLPLVVTTVAALSCLPAPVKADEPLDIWVSILPQRGIVQAIAGEHARTEVLVKPGQSPATYEPTPRQMVGLEGADLLIRIGAPFEASLLRNVEDLLPNLEVLDGRRGIELVPMEGRSQQHASPAHDHHDHGSGLADPHFWLDPLLMKIHAATICDALGRRAPELAGEFRSRLAALQNELDATHRRVADRLAPFEGREILVFHPAYGYFARRYGLRQMAVEVGGKEPTARQLGALVDTAREAGVRSIFVQPQFSAGAARAISSAIGADLVELDPLPDDYLGNLELMADRISAALGEPAHD